RAAGEKGRVGEVEDARVADHDVEPEGEEDVDHRVRDRVHRLRLQPAVDEGIGEERGDQEHRGEEANRARVAHALSGTRSPSNPWGRKIKTRMRMEKTMAFVHRAEMYCSLHAERKPMTRPPRAAPGMLPMPPSTAAVKARKPAW